MLACLGLLLIVLSCLAVEGFSSALVDYGLYVHYTSSYTSVNRVLFLLQCDNDCWVQLHVTVRYAAMRMLYRFAQGSLIKL